MVGLSTVCVNNWSELHIYARIGWNLIYPLELVELYALELVRVTGESFTQISRNREREREEVMDSGMGLRHLKLGNTSLCNSGIEKREVDINDIICLSILGLGDRCHCAHKVFIIATLNLVFYSKAKIQSLIQHKEAFLNNEMS